jgi:hypothetical protein
MLDVHAPHGPTHGWRDFLLHIVAIAIGLLLALALEKVAEYIHERRQLSEARRELSAEIARNRDAWSKNLAEASRVQHELVADLKIIQALRAQTPINGVKFDYSVNFYAANDGAWQAVRSSGALTLMPDVEVQSYAWFHGILASLMEAMHAFETSAQIGGAIAASETPEKINTHDLDELATRTMEAQGRLEHLQMFLKFETSGLSDFYGAKTLRLH